MTIENDIFADPNEDVTLNTLVGEGRKYSNADELAKGYSNAEGFIQQLKAELAQERAKLQSNVINADGNADPSSITAPNPPVNQEPARSPAPDGNEVDWRQNIRKELEAITSEERYKKNVEDAAQAMVSRYGSKEKAQEAIQKRAVELGVSPEWLGDSAGKSPAAFFATMGVADKATDRTTPSPLSEVRSLNQGNGNRNYAYYEEIRKTNKSQYFSPSVQKQMFEDAKQAGADFYNTR